MIIWAGWGVLAVVFPAAGAGVFAALASAMNVGDGAEAVIIGLGIIIGAVGAFIFGRWINGQDRARQAAEKLLAGRRHELDHLVNTRQFQLAPGYPPPNSYDEARAQAHYVYETELGQISKGLTNRHTVFWVPMQWIAVLAGMAGVFVAIIGLV